MGNFLTYCLEENLRISNMSSLFFSKLMWENQNVFSNWSMDGLPADELLATAIEEEGFQPLYIIYGHLFAGNIVI